MPIHYEKSDGIAVLTIDNPPVNVFTPALHKEMYDILRDFNADPSVRCGILTGAGDRAFSAGDDIKSLRPEQTRLETVERHLTPRVDGESLEYPGWEQEIMTLPRYKPMIGAINGVCVGQGFMFMMMLTDIRYAVPNARFGLPEIAYGMGGAGGALGLGKMIPHTAAMELLLLGDKVSAEKAERMFLINGIVEADDLMAHARQAANRIASHPAIGIRVEMEAYQRSQDMSRSDAMALSGHMYRMIRTVQGKELPLARKGAAQ
jgi:enoyl-CoA hydratase/carnithine racemase